MTVTATIIANAAHAAIKSDRDMADMKVTNNDAYSTLSLLAWQGLEVASKDHKVGTRELATALSAVFAANPIVIGKDDKGNDKCKTMGKDMVAYYGIAGYAIAKDEPGRAQSKYLCTKVEAACNTKGVSRDAVRKACKNAKNIADAITAVAALIPGKTEAEKFSARINAALVNTVAARDMDTKFVLSDADRKKALATIAAMQTMLDRK